MKQIALLLSRYPELNLSGYPTDIDSITCIFYHEYACFILRNKSIYNINMKTKLVVMLHVEAYVSRKFSMKIALNYWKLC